MQRAVRFANQPLNNVQTEPGPVARAFCGEIRLEYFRQNVLRNARTIIEHRQL